MNVPAGDYVIRCFQDLNKNGKLDFVEGGPHQRPDEPWGLYRYSWLIDWDDCKFRVDKDITGIKIDLRK